MQLSTEYPIVHLNHGDKVMETACITTHLSLNQAFFLAEISTSMASKEKMVDRKKRGELKSKKRSGPYLLLARSCAKFEQNKTERFFPLHRRTGNSGSFYFMLF